MSVSVALTRENLNTATVSSNNANNNSNRSSKLGNHTNETSSLRNVRKSEKLFKKLQQEIELSSTSSFDVHNNKQPQLQEQIITQLNNSLTEKEKKIIITSS